MADSWQTSLRLAVDFEREHTHFARGALAVLEYEGIKLPNLGGTNIRPCRGRKKHNMLWIDKDAGHLARDVSRK